MRKRKFFILFAALTAGSLLLNGCSLTDIPKEDTTLSAEMENENLADGTIQMHSSWYDTEGNALVSATITISEGKDEIFSGTTDENGNLELCSLPGNSTMKCTITDSTGETIGSSDFIFKISSDYTAITIYPVRNEDNSECIVEVPNDRTEIRAGIFLTKDQTISFANISRYAESAAAEENTEDDAAAEGADANTGGDPAAGADANAGGVPTAGADANAADDPAVTGDAAAQ